MAWGFRKSIKIAPGVRINLSKSGVSTTIGGRGASVNIGKKGTYLNTGIPGTGLYNREKISGGSSRTYEEAPPVIGGNTSEASTSPFLRHVGIGVIVVMIGFMSIKLPGLALISSAILFARFIAHITKKSKPIYGDQPVYKQDRRYKTGQRLEGYQKVKIGVEPLSAEEISQNKKIAYVRLAYSAILLILGLYFLAAK